MSIKNKKAIIGLDIEDMQEWLQERAYKEETSVEGIIEDLFTEIDLSQTEKIVGFQATGDADIDESLYAYFISLTGMTPDVYAVN